MLIEIILVESIKEFVFIPLSLEIDKTEPFEQQSIGKSS